MPDPQLYATAMCLAAIASAIAALAIGWFRRPVSAARFQLGSLLGLALGLALGYQLLHTGPAWPPSSALDRILAIVLPAALFVESLATIPRSPKWLIATLRFLLAASCGRILLHGSVYLSNTHTEWTDWQAVQILTACAIVLTVVWGSLTRLSRNCSRASIALALAMAIQCGGIAIMLAGYIKGGAAAIPLTGVIIGVTLASTMIRRLNPDNGIRSATNDAVIGIGVIGLFSLLFVGRFFGRLSSAHATTLMLAPILCWVTELPLIRNRSSRFTGTIRLICVAIPLVIVLILAKLDFDQKMGLLL